MFERVLDLHIKGVDKGQLRRDVGEIFVQTFDVGAAGRNGTLRVFDRVLNELKAIDNGVPHVVFELLDANE